MKKEFLLSLNDIDESYLEDARPKVKRKPILTRIAVAAVALLIVSVASIVMLRNTPDDNFIISDFGHAVIDYLINDSTVNEIALGAPGGSDDSNNGSYMEITDNQIEGIIEGDLAKATDKYLFRLGNHTIYTYSIDGENSSLISTYTIPYLEGEKSYFKYYDMFLSDDGNTLTLFAEHDGGGLYGRTVVTSIDVSDVTNPKEKNQAIINGWSAEVRRIGDQLYVITNWKFQNTRVDIYKPETYIPSIEYADGRHICETDKIIYPEKLSGLSFKYLTILDEGSLTLSDELAMMVSGNAYFTESSIIFDNQYFKTVTDGDKTTPRCFSDISVLNISGGLSWKGKCTIKGWAKDQYSFDERDGVLRIVASVSDRVGTYSVIYDSVSFYAYDIESMTQIAAVEEFAPYGEGATAVRFNGDKLYVCTAVIFSDPVFFFDLKDYNNITYTDTGYIDGFSSSLIDLGDGYLLGVGREDSATGKLEIYKKDGEGVVSVDKMLLYGQISTEYKSYLVDRENNLFGLAISEYTDGTSKRANVFLTLHFDGEKICEVSRIVASKNYTRAFFNDGFIYLTIPDSLYVADTYGNTLVELSTTHSNGEGTTIDEAECGKRPTVQYECSCGRIITRLDYSADYTEHEILDGICTLCGKDLGSAEKNSDLILYMPNGDGTCTVTGTRETLCGVVIIPKKSPKGDTVTAIGKEVFSYSTIEKITIPGSVVLIDDHAFFSCNRLTEIKLDGIKKIGKKAFIYCESLVEANLSSAGEIGEWAFASCKSLKTVILSGELSVINGSMFNQCESLASITIPESVTKIEPYAFNFCTSLVTIDIPDKVTEIGMRTFGDCYKLISVELGQSVVNIDEKGFENCTSIYDIVNRSALDIVAGSTDHGQIALYATSISKDESGIVAVGDYLFVVSDKKTVLAAYIGDDTELTLPSAPGGGEYEIGNNIFKYNKSITSVIIPEGVTAIGDYAFFQCNNLTEVSLPNSLISIGYRSFAVTKVKSIIMGDNVISIGNEAFLNSRLEEIRLSSNLKTIGWKAFYGCDKLTSIDIPAGVTEIGDEAFSTCSSIVSFVIPDGITRIGKDFLRGCSSLTSVVIPSSVTYIDEAFYSCKSLKTIYYKGSEEEWEAIEKMHNNNLWSKVTIVYNYNP